MTCHRVFRTSAAALSVMVVFAFSSFAAAQGPLPDAPSSGAIAPASPVFVAIAGESSAHKFWDKENYALFAGVAAGSSADFVITRSNLQGGGQELNPMVRVFGRSTAGLAVNFVGEAAGVVGVSYFLHRTGHHRLERLTSMVNMGASASAVTYSLAHRETASRNVDTHLMREIASFSVKIKLGSK